MLSLVNIIEKYHQKIKRKLFIINNKVSIISMLGIKVMWKIVKCRAHLMLIFNNNLLIIEKVTNFQI
jgi:hypothetical protein